MWLKTILSHKLLNVKAKTETHLLCFKEVGISPDLTLIHYLVLLLAQSKHF